MLSVFVLAEKVFILLTTCLRWLICILVIFSPFMRLFSFVLVTPGARFTKYLTIMTKLQSTYNGRSIFETSHEGHKAFLRYNFIFFLDLLFSY